MGSSSAFFGQFLAEETSNSAGNAQRFFGFPQMGMRGH
jgi:hypothetical protein